MPEILKILDRKAKNIKNYFSPFCFDLVFSTGRYRQKQDQNYLYSWPQEKGKQISTVIQCQKSYKAN